jgi:hypothetical protein
MPREDRRIYFDYEETYKALFALCIQREFKKPPAGIIKAIEVNSEDSTKLTIQIDNPLEHASHRMEYSRDFLAAALMLFCRSQSIPLPKAAQKSVEFNYGTVILRVQI